jgi:crossover junction endodeoxyribonuclease RuvC
MRILGIDPGLRNTGWGIIEAKANRLSHLANGVLNPDVNASIALRLLQLNEGIADIIGRFAPDEVAVEETFVNKNPDSTLKLGLARGAVLIAPAKANVTVTEYAPNRVKKSVVGAGHADKAQIQIMVARLLPGCQFENADAADALAVAICHAHFAGNRHAFGADAGKGQRHSKTETVAGTGYERAVRAALARENNR